MLILIVDIEKNGFFGKKSIQACISLLPIEGEIVIHIPDTSIENEIRKCIDIPNDDIKSKGISEQTFIFGRISENLRNRKFNGGRVIEMTVFEY